MKIARGRGKPDSILSIYIPAFVLATGVSIAAPSLPLYAKSFNVDFGTASLVIVVNQLGAALSTVPTGVLIQRFGARRMVLLGPILTALASFLLAGAHTFPELLVYRFIEGWAMQMWMLGRLELIAARAGGRRGTQISGMWGMDAAGRLTGPAIGGFVAAAYGLRAPFVLYGVMALAAILPSFFLISETRADRTVALRNSTDWRALMGVVATPHLALLLLAGFLGSVTRGSLFGGTLDLYAVYAYGIGPQTIGILAAAGGLLGLPFNFITGPMMDRFGRRATIVPGFCLLGLALVGMAVAATASWPFRGYVAMFLLTRMALGTVNGSMQVVAADAAPPQVRGPFFGIWSLNQQVGNFVSPAVFAVISQSLSFGAAFTVLGALSVGTAMVLIRELGGRPAPVLEPAVEVALF